MTGSLNLRTGKFPDGFMWSTATASYQVEGGWNEDGKGESVWDVFSHTPGNIDNNDNGDIACDSYHKIPEDVEALKKLGVSHYRFSLSWPRILPKGTKEVINKKGINYYNNLINALLKNNIQPVVTLFHWDLPQCLQDKYGGWISRDVVDHFIDYADICFQSFGDRVRWWTPLNEPIVVSSMAYGTGQMAPGIKNQIGFSFEVCHHLIIAHVEAWHLYNNKYKSLQGGKVGMNASSDWAEPFSSNLEDVDASERLMLTRLGLFCDPICGNGDYPSFIKERFKALKNQGVIPPDAFMPEFSDKDILRNKGSLDFFGLNYYTSRLVKNLKGDRELTFPFLNLLAKAEAVVDPSWERGASCWLYSVPWGLRKLLSYIWNHYGSLPVFVLENGFSTSNGELDDTSSRVKYLKEHLEAILDAITEDRVNVIGYTVWSLMDNFEWHRGYSEQFGLFRVDQKDPQRKRVPKKSVEFYAEVIRKNGFDPV